MMCTAPNYCNVPHIPLHTGVIVVAETSVSYVSTEQKCTKNVGPDKLLFSNRLPITVIVSLNTLRLTDNGRGTIFLS